MASTSIHIAQPCHESWEAMTPVAAGRHCAACQKVVVDFTQKTDAEILAHLAHTTRSRLCGRFRATQLARPLVADRTVVTARWRTWLGTLLAAATVGPLSSAQAIAPKPAAFVAPPAETALAAQILPVAEAVKPISEYRLAGIIMDAKAKQGIPGVTIQLQGTKQGITTDADGKFVLPITTDNSHVTLLISSIGYQTVKKRVALRTASKSLLIQLRPEHFVLGGIAYTKPSATIWQRLARLYT